MIPGNHRAGGNDARPQPRVTGYTLSCSITPPVYTVSILLHPVKYSADHLHHNHHQHTHTCTHTHTHTTHAQNTRTQNNQDFNYFMTHTNCPTPSVHSGVHWRWILISPAKMVPTIICQVGIDYTLTPLHSLILPFYYSGEGTLFSRSFLNVLYAF